jgi:ferredoxin-thioredoxin reductase catalytic subunit
MIMLEEVRQRAEIDARTHGCYLTPDQAFLHDLLEGLKKNEERYGYPACPCRMAVGEFELDRDIVCPCDYRDPDVEEFDACYCALYVSKAAFEGKKPLGSIPERRPLEKQLRAYGLEETAPETKGIGQKTEGAKKIPQIDRKLFYCRQCGYIVFREEPPYVCPICRAKRDKFSELTIRSELMDKT